MAGIIALVYNWWNIFCRLAEPEEHMEAKTSRSLFFNSICKVIKTSGQKFIKITINGAKRETVMSMLRENYYLTTNIVSTAPQLTIEQKWVDILTHAFKVFLAVSKL